MHIMYEVMNWWQDIWQHILNFLSEAGRQFDQFILGIFNFDSFVIGAYTDHISGFPEIVKIIGALFVVFLLVLGIISLIKKSLKLVIILAIIALVFWFTSQGS